MRFYLFSIKTIPTYHQSYHYKAFSTFNLTIQDEKLNTFSQSQMLQMFLCKHAHQNIIFTIIIIATLLASFHSECNLHISGQNRTETSGQTIGQSCQSNYRQIWASWNTLNN